MPQTSEDFVPVTCNQGTARITRRKVLHGSGPALITVAQCYRGVWCQGITVIQGNRKIKGTWTVKFVLDSLAKIIYESFCERPA